jgi:hypothetical protein
LKQWLGLAARLSRQASPRFDALKRCAELGEARRLLGALAAVPSAA